MTDEEFQKWKKLTQNRYSEEYDRLNEQQSERLFEFVPKTEEELLDKYGIYVKKYSNGGEVSEFQRKTRRDIMQESLVDGKPDYNKMFQNQNEYQKDFANYWYTERSKNPKYSDQIGGDKLNSVLSNIDKATWKTPTEAMRDNMVGQGYNPTDAQVNQQLNILKEKGTKGFANPKAHSYTSLRPANTWHEGVGHMVGDNTPAILNATPNVRISNSDSSYEDYVNQANEKHAQTWDFRGNNSNLKDDQGNYYIDPNRQLTPEDMGEYEYQYDINGVPYGTTIHEMNHNADYLKNKAADADANSNLYYWMRSALKPFSRIDPNTDKLTKYYSKPTEQKAYMNQLREFMYANKMIDTRDQIVTPDLIKQAISKLPKGMQSIKKASEQFKSMRSYTKWFNTIPLLGVGAVGANKYFTSNENRD